MEQLSRVQSRVENLTELRAVVGGIRSISAVRSQQAQQALLGARRHTEIVEGALSAVIASLPEPPPPEPAAGPEPLGLVILYTSEHGFVGPFNEVIVSAAAERLARRPAELLVLGSRGAQVAEERGLSPAWTGPLSTRAEGVLADGRRVAAELYARVAGRDVTVEVGFMRSERGRQPSVEWRRVLPLDLQAFAPSAAHDPPPLRNLSLPELMSRLVEEYVLAELVRAGTESFASENLARLLAMTTASEGMKDKLAELTRLAAHLRQEEITTELLDVVTGAEALLGEELLQERRRRTGERFSAGA